MRHNDRPLPGRNITQIQCHFEALNNFALRDYWLTDSQGTWQQNVSGSRNLVFDASSDLLQGSSHPSFFVHGLPNSPSMRLQTAVPICNESPPFGKLYSCAFMVAICVVQVVVALFMPWLLVSTHLRDLCSRHPGSLGMSLPLTYWPYRHHNPR